VYVFVCVWGGVCVCVCVYVFVGVCVRVCVCVECVCVCVWGCACACVCPSLRCGFASRSVREVWLCLCMIHMKQTSWDAADALSWPQDATRTSPFKPPAPTDRRDSTKCSEVFATKLLFWFPISFKGLSFWYKFYEYDCCLCYLPEKLIRQSTGTTISSNFTSAVISLDCVTAIPVFVNCTTVPVNLTYGSFFLI
jgi:hypothetical protein